MPPSRTHSRARAVVMAGCLAVVVSLSAVVGGAVSVGSRLSASDEPDASDQPQTHVIYFVAKDGVDEELDANGTLADAIRGIRAWFARETSSDGRRALRPRIDSLQGGGFDISFVRGNGNKSEYTSLDRLYDELAARGFKAANKRYLVFAGLSGDAPGNPGGTCGQGYYPLPAFELRQLSVVYLDANPGCGTRNFGGGTAGSAGRAEAVAVEEWLHNEGIVPAGAPHHCPTNPFHICTAALWMVSDRQWPVEIQELDPEVYDVMFPLAKYKLSNLRLDPDRDDYLDHGLPITDLRQSPFLETVG